MTLPILTDKDLEAYIRAFQLPEERRDVLRVVVDQANERTASDAELIGEPTVFLRAAADSLVMMILCRQDKNIQKKFASSYWNLIRLHKQLTEVPQCRLH